MSGTLRDDYEYAQARHLKVLEGIRKQVKDRFEDAERDYVHGGYGAQWPPSPKRYNAISAACRLIERPEYLDAIKFMNLEP